ncbi:MAG: hypothetical protein ACRDJW_13090 [Thermomicrobiales bacterium]
MVSRFDDFSVGNFALKNQVVLLGEDADGNCEFDTVPTITEFGTNRRAFWKIEFAPGDVVPYVHKCPDGSQISCFQATVKCTISAIVLVEYDRETLTKVLKVCPCDCLGETGTVIQRTAGRALPAGKKPGQEFLMPAPESQE